MTNPRDKRPARRAVCLLLWTPCLIAPLACERPTSIPLRIEHGMARVPAGEFMMGCGLEDGACADEERPVHRVRVRELWLDVVEVRADDYRRCVQAGGCWEPSRDDRCSYHAPGRGSHPMDCVSWEGARDYCRYRGKRLPWESEWEAAARAGAEGTRPGELDRQAWHEGNSGGTTHPVGLKEPNALGLHDMLGNAWEWCGNSLRADDYQKPAEDGRRHSAHDDPPEGNEDPPFRGIKRFAECCCKEICDGWDIDAERRDIWLARPIRGGGADARADQVRVSARGRQYLAEGRPGLGFRCARSTPPSR